MNTPPPTPAAPATIYERDGRQRKVLKLCMAIDGALDMMGRDPFSPAALEAVLAMDAKAWSEAAKHARVPLASKTTQGMVTDVYAKRVEVRVALQRIPLRAVAR
jgi:hypothetical protein